MITSIFTADGIDFIRLVMEILTLLIASALAVVGIYQYAETKRNEKIKNDFEIRYKFIMDPTLCEIQERIEHRDKELKRVLNRLIEANDPYDSELLTKDERKLHQQLDNYINILEAVGSLKRKGWLEKYDRGFWEYYF